jgi:hypothetical protein
VEEQKQRGRELKLMNALVREKKNEGSSQTHISPFNTRMQLLHVRKGNHVSLQYTTMLLQKPDQRIKLGSICGRLLVNRNVVWMPFSELTVCLIIYEAEGKEDVGNVLVLERSLLCRERVANYKKKMSRSIDIRGKTSLHRIFGTYRFCFGGRRFFQELNMRT